MVVILFSDIEIMGVMKYMNIIITLEGMFSAVSTPIFASIFCFGAVIQIYESSALLHRLKFKNVAKLTVLPSNC